MKMKSKNNWTMRAAVLMFALVLITSSFVGGTFAKYVTSGEATGSARVAKFGVDVTATGNMFAAKYTKNDGTVIIEGTSYSVESENSTDKVVAPGTKGNMATLTLSGKPEVAVKVTYTLNKLELSGWEVNPTGAAGTGTYYCPLVINVGNDAIKGTDYSSADDFIAAVKDKVTEKSQIYAANTNLATEESDMLAISWEWPFTGNDINDTKLGNATTAPTIEFQLTATVTQID